MKLLVLNGPNLQLLGQREPERYGTLTLPELETRLTALGESLGCTVVCRQSNHEGDLLDWIAAMKSDGFDGLVINPGAYGHTSIALRDAILGTGCRAVEVHITNIHAREPFRHATYLADVCIGQIAGLGTDGYEWALRSLCQLLRHTRKP